MKQYLEAGQFVTTHAIAGELKLYPWCDDAAFLSGINTLYLDDTGKAAVKAEQIRPHKNMCIVKLQGVNSIDEARKYIGKTVYIWRGDVQLPEGRYFVQDILGAKVQNDTSGEIYGIIKNVSHPGRHDVYEIERANGSTVLFPAAEPFIGEIDIENGVINIKPIAGMFDDTN